MFLYIHNFLIFMMHSLDQKKTKLLKKIIIHVNVFIKKLKKETLYWISLTNNDPILPHNVTSFAFHISVVWSTWHVHISCLCFLCPLCVSSLHLIHLFLWSMLYDCVCCMSLAKVLLCIYQTAQETLHCKGRSNTFLQRSSTEVLRAKYITDHYRSTVRLKSTF